MIASLDIYGFVTWFSETQSTGRSKIQEAEFDVFFLFFGDFWKIRINHPSANYPKIVTGFLETQSQINQFWQNILSTNHNLIWFGKTFC